MNRKGLLPRAPEAHEQYKRAIERVSALADEDG
jgi:hypothetical protein